MRKLRKIEEIQLQIWKGPLYNLSKYAVSFGLGPQIRVHRPLHFPWWPPIFANGPLLYPPQTKFGGVYRNQSVCLSVRLSVQSKLNLDHNFLTKRDRTSVFLVTRPFCRYQNFWLRDLDLEFWPTFEKNLTLAITFETKEIGLSYFTCVFLVTRPFCRFQNFWLCDLDLDFRPTFEKKLNLGHNFWTKRDRAFIFHMCISCGKTFLLIPKYLTSWPWPWLLTYFWKNLTLAITFEPKEIGLSYFTCVFLVARPFCRHQYFLPSGLDLDFDLLLEKLKLVAAGGIRPVKTDPDLVFVNFIYILLRDGPLAHFEGPSLHKFRVFPD